MQKQESVLENETHKILWDFEIQTDPLIPTRRLLGDPLVFQNPKEFLEQFPVDFLPQPDVPTLILFLC